VPSLAHQLGEAGTLVAGGGGEADAQRVAGAGIDRCRRDPIAPIPIAISLASGL
jgi:hypothetical protein